MPRPFSLVAATSSVRSTVAIAIAVSGFGCDRACVRPWPAISSAAQFAIAVLVIRLLIMRSAIMASGLPKTPPPPPLAPAALPAPSESDLGIGSLASFGDLCAVSRLLRSLASPTNPSELRGLRAISSSPLGQALFDSDHLVIGCTNLDFDRSPTLDRLSSSRSDDPCVRRCLAAGICRGVLELFHKDSHFGGHAGTDGFRRVHDFDVAWHTPSPKS